MIECNVFELELSLLSSGKSSKLNYRYWTDLPCGTLVGLSVTRSYEDFNDEVCLWTLFDDELIVSPGGLGDFNGGTGIIDIEAGDRDGAEEFEEFLADFSSGIKTQVSDEITVNLSVGARQRLRAFGKCNKNLTGAVVREIGGIHVVEVSKTLRSRMLEAMQPIS